MNPAARRSLATTLTAVAVALGFVYWPIFSGRAVFFDRDISLYWRPHIEWAVRTVAEGHWPSWIPGSGFGMPFLADPSFQAFYPITWLNLLLLPAKFYPLYVTSHALLGAWGAWRLARLTTRSNSSAALAALLFALSGPWVSAANLWHHYAGVAYLPWVVWGAERVRLRVPGAWRGLGIAAGLQALAGSADLCVASTTLAAARLLTAPRRRFRLVIPDLALAVALATCLGAVQWLPTANLLSTAERSGHATKVVLYWSVPPASLPDMFVPAFLFDQQQADEWRDEYLEGRSPLLASFYLGAAALPFAVLGALRWPAGASVFLGLLIVSMGKFTPLGPVLAHVPPLSWLRYPMKAMLPATLVFALLAAVGLRAAFRRCAGSVQTLPKLMALVLLMVGIFLVPRPFELTTLGAMTARLVALSAASISLSRLGGSPLRFLCLALVVADVSHSARFANRLAPPELERYRPPHVDAVRETTRGNRIHVSLTIVPADEAPRSRSADPAITDVLVLHDRLVPPQLLRWGLLGSVDPDFTGLASRDFAGMLARAERRSFLLPFLKAAGVGFGLRFGRFEPTPGAVTLDQFETAARGMVRLVKLPWSPARVRRVGAVIPSESAESAFDALLDPEFDPLTMAVTRDGPPLRGVTDGFARVVSESPSRLVIETQGTTESLLILNDEWRPGWTATVDARPAPIERTNALFRGVRVPAGRSEVVFRYATPGLRAGAALSLLSVIGLALSSRTMTRWRNPGS